MTVMSMRDFFGHEMQVGDIVAAPDDSDLMLARVEQISGERGSVQVRILGDSGTGLYWYHPTQLMWHSSDYAQVSESYLLEIFGAVINRRV